MKLSSLTLDGWITLLKEQVIQRPDMQPRDVYKLLYQGVLGPEHLIASPTSFASRLKAEIDSLSSGSNDPLYEIIHPDQALLRVNLRPFKAARLDLQLLIDACLKTADLSWGEPADLRRIWDSITNTYHQHPFASFTHAEVDEFTHWLTDHNFPAVHHSQIYRDNYAPAYRLVAGDLAIT